MNHFIKKPKNKKAVSNLQNLMVGKNLKWQLLFFFFLSGFERDESKKKIKRAYYIALMTKNKMAMFVEDSEIMEKW